MTKPPEESKTENSSHAVRLRLTFGLWILSFLGLLAAGGWVVYNFDQLNRGALSPGTNDGSVYAGKPVLQGFQLINTEGKPLAAEALLGQPSLFFFGYTYCPDVCPTTIQDISGWFAALGDEAKQIKVYFVSVDPDRDTPEAIKAFLTDFSAQVEGFATSPDELPKLKKQFYLYVAKSGDDPDYYLIDHTASIYMVTRDGHLLGTLSPEESEEAILGKLRRLVAMAPAS